MTKFRLSFGDPVVVREVLNSLYTPKLNLSAINEMGYPPYEGLPELVSQLKKMLNYNYVLVTSGTTSSLNFVLSALQRNEGRNIAVTNMHYFPYYPDIIKHANYVQEISPFEKPLSEEKKVHLVDIPSNPWGNIMSIKDLYNNVVWDSVYANPVYINTNIAFQIEHRVNVGSFSKMLGLAGLRIGWIATNNEEDYNLFYNEIKYKSCGTSTIAQDLIIDILQKLDMDSFLATARTKVNYNREEFLKLSSFFDGQVIPVNGMFYPVWVDDKGLAIIERAGVQCITLETKGNKSLIRFNLAQNNTITQKAVKAIKTADRIKK